MQKNTAAIDVVARFLARRDYSEYELRQRLQQKDYSAEEIDAAMEEAIQRRWLLPPEELATRVARELHAKGKSYRYIANYLTSKKLPHIQRDEDLEIQKAQGLVQKKFHFSPPYDFEQKKKILQYLRNRTYDEPTIRTVLNEVE